MSFGLDRVAVPMEEPRPRAVGRPRATAAKRPVSRVYRMAYCGTVTLHGADGAALRTTRHGAVPSADPKDLGDRFLADANAILAERPEPRVVLLADGAPEMKDLPRDALDATTLGTRVTDLLNIWQLLEKLAAAARVAFGEPPSRDVMRRWHLDLLNRNAAPYVILATFRASARRHVRVGDARLVHEAITYLEQPRPHGLSWRPPGLLGPIGSGATEAS